MSGYIGTQPVPQATQHRETFTATASQTTFATVGYTPQFVDVYLNGVHLLDTVDYTATNSSDVVLTTGAAASDVVEIISYTPFEVANQTFTGTTTVDVLTTTGAFTSLGIDDNATSTAITIDASENVGIGVVNPTAELDVAGSGKFSGTVSLPRATTETASIEVGTGRSGNGSALIDLVGDATYTDFGTRLIRTSGGANANSQLVHRGTGELSLNASDAGSITLRTAGLTRLTVDASGNVGIGNVAPDETLEVSGDIKSSGSGFGIYHFGDTSDVTKIVGRDASHASLPNTMGFYTNSAERLRIDASGNVLLGKTTADNTTEGFTFYGTHDGVSIVKAGGQPLILNRLTSDGDILTLRKDGSTVGGIGSRSGSSNLFINSKANSGRLACNGTEKYGWNVTTFWATTDNANDLGSSSNRWDDVYATNGTIQTSDRNEKQQIAALTTAEITAAKAISAGFKTFKWNDSVAEKGADAARTHSGVIAQEVEQALTDAGLDAGDYAFFISNTWWETHTEVLAVEAVEAVYEDVVIPAVLDADGNELEAERTEQRFVTEAVEAKEAYTRTENYDTLAEAPEGATERTRKGIRYPQLLAFVGAATEQRLASIETRLTALEVTP